VIHAFLRRQFRLRQQGRDRRVVHFFGQAVAAQQDLEARAQLAGNGLDLEVLRVGHAERLRHHIAMRVGARLFRRDCALVDQFLHVAVVGRKLAQCAVPQVGAAVADPGQFETVVVQTQRHHRRAHRQAFGAPSRLLDDVLVGGADRVLERLAGPDLAHHGIAGQGAGDFAELVPAHAVRDQPQAQVGIAVIGVLVQLAAQADVAEVAKLDHPMIPRAQ